ncbi:MAG TPA: SGNH/GDSL hydrolase family protein [Lachnospiraceae bacterium]|nr:SGNH/GDSL hydrolase family protein [Lachnospiraceae bacterium]
MKHIERIEILGDSILKGIQVNPINKRYYTKNDIDINMLSNMYKLTITNESRFGCTVTKGYQIITKKLEKGMECDAIVMDFGGNDCDYKWEDIAANPSGKFEPNTPLETFIKVYTNLVNNLKEKNIMPILMTLPPLEPQRFFDWWCCNLNKENVMKWLGSVDEIYNHQALYSSCIEEIAKRENLPLIDIRSAFLENENVGNLICEDGTHPNSNGQKVITEVFKSFIQQRLALA